MTKWEVYTWLAIGVLVVGSLAVFGWFLRDALRLYRRLGRGREVGKDGTGAGGP